MSSHVPCVSLALIVYVTHRARMQHGWTPLARASYYGHLKTVEVLLAHKADVNAKDKVSRRRGGEGVPMGG